MTNLHLVTHTHWDREWYLTFQQFRMRLVHLMDHLLHLLETDPDFKSFTLDGQTIPLEDYLAVRPERETELRTHIASQRLWIGPWYVLPDEFLVSPEALIRNLLEGERVARIFSPPGSVRKLQVGYIPDPFGHIGQMPQILLGFGIHSACLMRGLADEPCELWWQSPDGSRVLLAYQRDGYGNAASLPTSHPEACREEISRLAASLHPHAATRHLLLMHGSDHVVPPADTSAAILYANQAGLEAPGDKLIHSNLAAYFEAIHSQVEQENLVLPTRTGELRSSKRYPLLPNVLSTRMWIKQRNHACQTLLEKWAEPFSTWAELVVADDHGMSLTGILSRRVRNPAPLIRQAWRLLLECHPHDSICGCSIDQVHEEMRVRFDQVEQAGEAITRQSLEILAEQIDTRWNDVPSSDIPLPSVPAQPGNSAVLHPPSNLPTAAVIAFNPAGGPRTGLVEAEIELPASLAQFEIVDEAGNGLPHQLLHTSTHELFQMPLDRDSFRNALAMVQDGRVENMTIREVAFDRDGETLNIDLVMAEGTEPNPSALRQSLQLLEKCLEDETVLLYVVRARSATQAHIQFVAQDVPEYGYRTYWLRPGNTTPPLPSTSPTSQAIENEFLRAEVSAEDGTVTLLDKRTGVVYLGLNRFVDSGDCGDEYNYAPPPEDLVVNTARVISINTRHEPVRQSIEISLAMEVPVELGFERRGRSESRVDLPIKTQMWLVPGLPRLDIRTTVDNGLLGGSARVRDHRLRVHFPAWDVALVEGKAIFDGHFELIRRSPGTSPVDGTWSELPRPEQPQRIFTALEGKATGMIVANTGLPEVEVIPASSEGKPGAEIALTLMRGVGWLSRGDLATRPGNAGPMHATPGAQMAGVHTFEYSVIPYAVGEAENLSILAYRQAYAYAAPLRARGAGLHPGNLPPEASMLRVSPAAFIISAVKVAEDGSGWIMRGYNLTTEPMQVELTPWRPFATVQRVNLAEEPQGTLHCNQDGTVRLSIGGCEIATLKFSL